MKSWTRHLTDRMEPPNQDKVRTPREKKTYKYLGILEPYTIKQMDMKEKINKTYPRKVLETKLSSRNLIRKIPGLYPSLDIRDPF